MAQHTPTPTETLIGVVKQNPLLSMACQRAMDMYPTRPIAAMSSVLRDRIPQSEAHEIDWDAVATAVRTSVTPTRLFDEHDTQELPRVE